MHWAAIAALLVAGVYFPPLLWVLTIVALIAFIKR